MKTADTEYKSLSCDYESKIRNIAGTLAIEGITLSDASRNDLKRIMSGKASCEQIIDEIISAYRKR